jgi:hypothetical protein
MTTSEPADEITRLRHDLLRVTDRAVGAEAEALRLRTELATVTTDRDRLAEQVRTMRASTTWRVGRALVAPAARVRGRRGRRGR